MIQEINQVDDLPLITVTWDEAQKPWRDFKATHPTVFSCGDLMSVDTSLEEQFFAERLVVTTDNVLHVRFSYDYAIDLNRIQNPIQLVRWAVHLADKIWMKKEFLEAFMEVVCLAKGWDPHGVNKRTLK